jgi:hypothetical protein
MDLSQSFLALVCALFDALLKFRVRARQPGPFLNEVLQLSIEKFKLTRFSIKLRKDSSPMFSSRTAVGLEAVNQIVRDFAVPVIVIPGYPETVLDWHSAGTSLPRYQAIRRR